MIKYGPTRKRIERCIELHNKMRWIWFRTPPYTASERRAMERLRSDSFKFKHKGVQYTVDQTTRCTCSKVIYKLLVTVNGEKKDVRALKKLVDWKNQRELEAIQAKLLATVNKNNTNEFNHYRRRLERFRNPYY